MEELMEKAVVEPMKLLDSGDCDDVTPSSWKCLDEKLLEIYLESSHNQTARQGINYSSNLLSRVVSKYCVNTLVVNLYPGNEGFSLLLHASNGLNSETIRLPYEEAELLEYIDNEKLPPLLVDLFDKAQANLFQCGCVIAEIRDYRRSTSNLYETQFVLLQPSVHTLVCDLNAMCCESAEWTLEDRLLLESELLLATSSPLCLDPSPAVFHITARLNHNKQNLNTRALHRCARRCSQAAVNRRRKLSLCTAPKHLQLSDFVKHRKNRNKLTVNLRLASDSCVDTWKQPKVELTTPDSIDVGVYAKALDRQQLTPDNSPVVVEEYMFETERRDGRVNMSRLIIMQRLSDESYLGTLHVDRDFRDLDSKGNACRFVLGTKAHVEKYVRQFREIFTEEGRRQVKITHQVPGRQPIVTYTQVSQPTAALAAAQGAGNTMAGSAIVTQGVGTQSIGSGVTSSQSVGSLSSQHQIPAGDGLKLAASATLQHSNSTAVCMPTYNLLASQHASGLAVQQAMGLSTQHATGLSTQHAPGLQSRSISNRTHTTNPDIEMLAVAADPFHAVAPPNVNIANISTLPPNLNIHRLQMHQPSTVQTSPGQQRSFVAMVTSPASFGGSHCYPGALSSPSAVFSLPINHNQFTVPPHTLSPVALSPVASGPVRSAAVIASGPVALSPGASVAAVRSAVPLNPTASGPVRGSIPLSPMSSRPVRAAVTLSPVASGQVHRSIALSPVAGGQVHRSIALSPIASGQVHRSIALSPVVGGSTARGLVRPGINASRQPTLQMSQSMIGSRSQLLSAADIVQSPTQVGLISQFRLQHQQRQQLAAAAAGYQLQLQNNPRQTMSNINRHRPL